MGLFKIAVRLGWADSNGKPLSRAIDVFISVALELCQGRNDPLQRIRGGFKKTGQGSGDSSNSRFR